MKHKADAERDYWKGQVEVGANKGTGNLKNLKPTALREATQVA